MDTIPSTPTTRLNQDDIENLDQLVMNNKIESVIKFPNKVKPRNRCFSVELYQTYKEEELRAIFFLRLFQKAEDEGVLSNSLYEANINLISKSTKDIKVKKKTIGQYPW